MNREDSEASDGGVGKTSPATDGIHGDRKPANPYKNNGTTQRKQSPASGKQCRGQKGEEKANRLHVIRVGGDNIDADQKEPVDVTEAAGT